MLNVATAFPAQGYENFTDYSDCMSSVKSQELPNVVRLDLLDEPIAVAIGDKDVAGALSFTKCEYSEDMSGRRIVLSLV